MTDQRLRLRGIVVSTRAALRHGSGTERILRASDDLLADLESDAFNDGADADLIRDIRAARREVNARRA